MSEYARYFNGYPQTVVEQALQLIAENKLSHYLVKKYPNVHTITTDKLLYNYATDLKNRYIKKRATFWAGGV